MTNKYIYISMVWPRIITNCLLTSIIKTAQFIQTCFNLRNYILYDICVRFEDDGYRSNSSSRLTGDCRFIILWVYLILSRIDRALPCILKKIQTRNTYTYSDEAIMHRPDAFFYRFRFTVTIYLSVLQVYI